MALKIPERGTPMWGAWKALEVIRRDAPCVDLYDDYLAGKHRSVYIPDNADAEFRQLAGRATLNLIPLVINSITQVCYVDSIRHTIDLAMDRDDDESMADLPPEMTLWQENGLDARQMSNVRALATHGLSYLLTRRNEQGKTRIEAFTARRAVALFEDHVNDTDPTWGFVIRKGSAENFELGHLYSETDWWEVRPGKGPDPFELKPMGPHGNSLCPVTRAALHLDLEGRPVGFVELVIQAQDQVNQTSFDILATQSYGSFNVRTATGMAVPVKRWTRAEIDATWPAPDPADPNYEELYAAWIAAEKPSVGDPHLDENGQEIPLPIPMNQKRLLVAEDPDTKFGQLEATDVRPLLVALDSRVKLLAAISQTPPTYLMGEMANLSAEALQAAEIAKTRRDHEIKMVLAEQYERALRLGMELEGHTDRVRDVSTEIVWADMDPRSMSAIADAYGKLAEQLGVPVTALWEDLPGMTSGKLKHWLDIRKKQREEEPELEMLRALDGYEALNPTGGVPVG